MLIKEDFAFLKNFIFDDDITRDKFHTWIAEICPYKVTLEDNSSNILFNDIENFVEGKWSSHILSKDISCGPYFFELETDAMAFKLRWL